MAEVPDAIIPGEPDEPEHEPIDLGGLLGGMDIGSLIGAAQSMQEQFAEAQARLAETVVEGNAGGGVVRISSTGDGRFTEVHISPDAFDPDDPSMLEDLVLAALHDVAVQVSALQNADSPLGGDGGLGALGLGDLGGLLGGP